MVLRSLRLTRIPVGSIHDSLIALVTTPTHVHWAVTYHGYADDTVLWGCSYRRIEGLLSADRETTERRRRTDMVGSFSASYTPIKNYFKHACVFLFFFFGVSVFFCHKVICAMFSWYMRTNSHSWQLVLLIWCVHCSQLLYHSYFWMGNKWKMLYIIIVYLVFCRPPVHL